MKKSIILFAVITFICSCAEKKDLFPNDEGMFPFVISFTGEDNATDISYLLDAPAGKYGYVRVEGDHFVTDNGPIKFNATNLTGPANFPTHEQADRLASRLARFGINCVRLHYMDCRYSSAFFGIGSQPSIFADDGSDRNFDKNMLDRLDYMIAKFKEKGIYVNVNLHVARLNKHLNETNKYTKDKEKEYAKDLLTHVNPYTGMTLAEDPCVAQVELDNEDSATQHYISESFHMEGWPFPRTTLRDSLTYEEQVAFLETLKKLDRDHWKEFYDFLKNEVGVKVPITSTQISYSYPWTLTDMDYYDNHAYWQHPRLGIYWRINNLPMVNSKDGGILTKLANSHFSGKPFTVSESNNPYPNFYGAEGQPMLHAFAAFQGWDGVYAYSWNNSLNEEPEMMEYFFSYAARTDALAHFISCAAMFLRGDVSTPAECYELPVPEEKYKKYWLRHCDKCYMEPDSVYLETTGGNAKYTSSLHYRTAVNIDSEVNTEFPKDSTKDVMISSTGEIEWNLEDPQNGMFFVRTKNSKLFTGFADGRKLDLGDGLKLDIGKTKLGWATISLTSMKANGFGEGSTTLLAATGYTHNTDAKFKANLDQDGNPTTFISCRCENWGKAPMITEGINAAVSFPSAAEKTKCWALNEKGERMTEVPVMKSQDGTASFNISSQYRTVWYEVSVD